MHVELLNLKELSLGDLEKIRLRGIRGMEEAIERVKPIIADVRARGDEALRLYEEKFTGVQSSYEIKVSEEEVEEAYGLVDKGFLEALRSSIAIVKRYHESCTPKPWVVEVAEGVRAGVIPRPVDRAGLYIPGGRAPYPSTVVMLAIPALTAGVKRVIACTPPSRGGRVNPYILVALSECGVKEVYRAGGAQAIAAMAYGTQTVPRVDVIAGPGNVYVTAAKLLVSSVVGIDVLAGPSELLVVADESAEPSLVAIDLASQAEHDPLSQIALATTSRELAERVIEELKPIASENWVVREVLEKSFIVALGDVDDVVEFANTYAPEHLQLLVSRPEDYVGRIRSAGALLVGPWTPTALSDYCAGPSHVLPTGGQAAFRSGVSTSTFMKFIHYVEAYRTNEELLRAAVKLAEAEGFKLHAEALRRRLKR